MTSATILKVHKWTVMTLGSRKPRPNGKYLILRPCLCLWELLHEEWPSIDEDAQARGVMKIVCWILHCKVNVWSGLAGPYGKLWNLVPHQLDWRNARCSPKPRQNAKYLILRPCHLPVFTRTFAWGMAIYWRGCSSQRSYKDSMLDFKLPSQYCIWSGSAGHMVSCETLCWNLVEEILGEWSKTEAKCQISHSQAMSFIRVNENFCMKNGHLLKRMLRPEKLWW